MFLDDSVCMYAAGLLNTNDLFIFIPTSFLLILTHQAAEERAGGGRERRKRATEGRARWLDRVLATLLSVPTASLMR